MIGPATDKQNKYPEETIKKTISDSYLIYS